MKYLIGSITIILFFSCSPGNNEPEMDQNHNEKSDSLKRSMVDEFYSNNHQDSIESTSIGTVSNGKLKNPDLLPFKGNNFICFDTSSYVNGRTFMHTQVVKTMLDAYAALNSIHPEYQFVYMECSNKQGGKLFPHRTHQNGMSVDLMSPLIKNGKVYKDLDLLGANHYLLEFNDSGRLTSDNNIIIDFELIAEHLLALNKAAKSNGLEIEKVIFKMELKDELYAGHFGKLLEKSGIYITRNLEPIINSLHDDHYHVDFKKL